LDYAENKRGQAAAILGDREYVVGLITDVKGLLERKQETATTGLAPAVALAAKGHTLVAALNPTVLPIPDDDKLPDEVVPFKALLKATAASVVVDVGTKTTARLRVSFASAENAAEGQKAMETGRKLGQKLLDQLSKLLGKDKQPGSAAITAWLGQLQNALKVAKLSRDGKEVTASGELKMDAQKLGKVAAALVPRLQEAARRAQSANNLKQIGIAMHNYHDATGTFPARAVFDKNGKPMLSWRVLILPYIEQDNLYKEFKLDEPWDSKHNIKLLKKMPITYRVPTERPAKAGYTFYQVFDAKGSVFEGKTGKKFTDISDGTSNTILVVEAGKAVPWTKPEDVTVEEGKPVPKLGGVFELGFNAGFADGSVRFFRKTISQKSLRAYITRNGGEVVGNDD